VDVLFFGLGCQGFWQAVGVDRGGDTAIVPVLIDQQGCGSTKFHPDAKMTQFDR
jgi:hypothetical protein